MPRLHFDLIVNDQGSLVVKKFTDNTSRYMHSAAGSVEGVARSLSTLNGILAGAGLAYGAGQIIKTADNYQNLHGRLKLVTSSTEQLAAVERDLFAASQQSRSGYGQTIDLYTRITRSTQDLNLADQQRLQITDTINKSLVISGASAEAANAALIQLGQGFASGVLRGEELRSVLEQAPRLAEAIADGMGVAVGKLHEMGKEGKLTAEAVVQALLSQSEAIQKEFSEMPKTVGQSMTVLNNSLGHLISGADRAGGATAVLAGHILDVSERIDKWAAANDGLIKQKVPEYIDNIGSSIQQLVTLYNSLPEGAGTGLIAAILFRSPPAGFIVALADAVDLLDALANSVAGFKAAGEGKISWLELATANAEELEAILDRINQKTFAPVKVEQFKAPSTFGLALAAEDAGIDFTAKPKSKGSAPPPAPLKGTTLIDKQAIAAAEAEWREFEKALADAQRVYESVRTPAEEYADEVTRLKDLYAKTGMSQETYNRAIDTAKKKYDEATSGAKELAAIQKASAEAYLASLPEQEAALVRLTDQYDLYRQAVLDANQAGLISMEEVFSRLDALDARQVEAVGKLLRGHEDTAERIEKIWEHTGERLQDLTGDWLRNQEFSLDSLVDLARDAAAEFVNAWLWAAAKSQAALNFSTAGTAGGALGTFTGTGALGSTVAGVGNLGIGTLSAGLSAAGATWDFLTGKTYSAVSAANNASSVYASTSSYGLDIAAANAAGSVEAFSTGLQAATAEMQIHTATFLKETLGMESTASSVLNMSQGAFSGVLSGGAEFLGYGMSTGDWEEATARGVTQGLVTWGLMSIPGVGPILALADAVGGGFITDSIWSAFGWDDVPAPRVATYGQLQYGEQGFGKVGGVMPAGTPWAGKTVAGFDPANVDKTLRPLTMPATGWYGTQLNKVIDQINPQIEAMLEAIPDAMEDKVREYFASTPIDVDFHQKSDTAFQAWAKMFTGKVNEALGNAYSRAFQNQALSSFLVSPAASGLDDPTKLTGALTKISGSDLSGQEKITAISSLFATIEQFVSSLDAIKGEVVDLTGPLLDLQAGWVKNTQLAQELGISVGTVNEVYRKQFDIILGADPEQISAGLVAISDGISRFEAGIERARAAGFGDLAEEYADGLAYLNDSLAYAVARISAGGTVLAQKDHAAVNALAGIAKASAMVPAGAGRDALSGSYADVMRREFADIYAALYPSSDLERQLAEVQEQYDRQVTVLRALADQSALLGTSFDDALGMVNLAAERQAQDLIANYIDPVTEAWKNGMDSLLFSDLAPVQSMEQYTARYNELLSGAKSGDEGATGNLFSFLQSDLLPFAQANMGAGYNDLWSSTMADLNTIPQAPAFNPGDFALTTPPAGDMTAINFQPIIDAINALADRPIEVTVNTTTTMDSQVVATSVAKATRTNSDLNQEMPRVMGRLAAWRSGHRAVPAYEGAV